MRLNLIFSLDEQVSFTIYTVFCPHCIAKVALSQNDVLFTQYFNNRLMINPAAAGSDKGLKLELLLDFSM
jgi:hypothetical protein